MSKDALLNEALSFFFHASAARQAKQKEKITNGLIIRSDQGTSHTSQAYYEMLIQKHNIPSTSQRANF